MRFVQLVDFKGDFWDLTFSTCQINKSNGLWYAFWYTNGLPEFLFKNGAHYDVVSTPVFTEWWT